MNQSSFLQEYKTEVKVWDEMYSTEGVRNHYSQFFSNLENIDIHDLSTKNDLARKLFMRQGITFTVYDNGEGIEKIFPFDIIPRIIEAGEWKKLEAGLKQRLKALNIFLKDIYDEQYKTAQWKTQ